MDQTLIPAWIDGVLTPFDKLETHRLGLRHMAVSVFVTNGDAILLQRRALGKYHTPGLWANSCCTHPHWGEAPEACANRRLHEELGITGLQPIYAGQVEYRADVGGGLTEHELVDVFVAAASPELPLNPAPSEVMAVRWMTLSDLQRDLAARPDLYTPWLKIYVERHFQMIRSAFPKASRA